MAPCNYYRKQDLPRMQPILEEMFKRLGSRIVIALRKGRQSGFRTTTRTCRRRERAFSTIRSSLRLLAQLDREMDLIIEHAGGRRRAAGKRLRPCPICKGLTMLKRHPRLDQASLGNSWHNARWLPRRGCSAALRPRTLRRPARCQSSNWASIALPGLSSAANPIALANPTWGTTRDQEMRSYFTLDRTLAFLEECERAGIDPHQDPRRLPRPPKLYRGFANGARSSKLICLHAKQGGHPGHGRIVHEPDSPRSTMCGVTL